MYHVILGATAPAHILGIPPWLGAGILIIIGNIIIAIFNNKSFKKSIEKDLEKSKQETKKVIAELSKSLNLRLDDHETILKRIDQIIDGMGKLEQIYENALRHAKDNKIIKVVTNKHKNLKSLFKELINIGPDKLHEESLRQKLQVYLCVCKHFTVDILGDEFTEDWYAQNIIIVRSFIDDVIKKMINVSEERNKYNNIIPRFMRIAEEFEEDMLSGILMQWEIYKDRKKREKKDDKRIGV